MGNDGVRNSEPAIAGVVLTLTGTNGLGQPVTATATTDANGFYQFINLAPGTYTVSGAAGGLHRRQGHRGQHGRQQRGQRRAQRHHAGLGREQRREQFW
ncbi:MAG: carboxypeptidase regulatory-like domain-containing protein [Candidatus Accumulibacter sp.]|uniref:Carboxypeptidase regulatory-like domain-containing protein n=1 Tax=Candidatus Accumulibacter proximus TaxID=2954385 RepID=A0A935PWC0_9PROT|nr:carboxypeptidase regulatory-like domain-containing protein [Candidatus Accumulibacter proximus]